MLEIIMQFVRGEIGFDAFYRAYCSDAAILACLEDAVTSLGEKHIPITYDALFRALGTSDGEDGKSNIVVPSKHHPTVRSKMEFFLNSDCSFAMKRAEIYDLIFSIVAALEPDTPYCRKYSDDFAFFLRAVPDYVAGGEAACDYIEHEIIEKLPPELSLTQKIKLCREKIRQQFHITGNKYPRWVQSAEWPIVNGEPARYSGYERTGDRVRYLFEDRSGNPVVVEQYD